MKRRPKICGFMLLCGILAGAGRAALALAEQNPHPRPATGLPAPFKIVESSKNCYNICVEFNPISNRYVVFYVVPVSDDLTQIYARLYGVQGKALGGPRLAFDIDEYLREVAIGYNKQDDRFLLVVNAYDKHRAVIAVALDGQGRRLADQPQVSVKTDISPHEGLSPAVAWIPETNQYAIAWSSIDSFHPDDTRNGVYLTVLNADLSLKVKSKIIRHMSCKASSLIPSIRPVGKRILWGTAEDDAQGLVRPVAWFTNLGGRIEKGLGAGGFIYPGPAISALGTVRSTYDPEHDRFLLGWGEADSYEINKATYWKNSFRIVDSRGVFRSATADLPRTAKFQGEGQIIYNPAEKRFFWPCNEYQILYERGERSYYGMKLWGSYLDHLGNLEDKKGNDKRISYPLTNPIKEPDLKGFFRTVAYNPGDNSYFVAYDTKNFNTNKFKCWGIIYK
jgi:hypothetical protein